MEKVHVIIADRNRLFRTGLSLILAAKAMKVVAEVDSAVMALEVLRSADVSAQLLICDPAHDGAVEFDALEDIIRSYPTLKAVVLTDHVKSNWSELSLSVGASGLLSKNTSPEALYLLLELALLGERIFPTFNPATSEARSSTPSTSEDEQFKPLTLREWQILDLVVAGQTNREIAVQLGVAEATVKVHMKTLLLKINVHNRTQAAIWGVSHQKERDLFAHKPGDDQQADFSP